MKHYLLVVNQIASCTLNFLQRQYENSFVCAMFILALQINLHLETIDHKFLEPGHTHMECDVDYSVIERKIKRTDTQIHHPHDCYNLVRCAGS